MDNTMEIVGPRIFSIPGVEIRMQAGRVYVNGDEVPREKIDKQALKLVSSLFETGTYEVSPGSKHSDKVSVSRPVDFRER